ncbi:hypothetical protein B0T10DRAFT_453678 [Thelonectria olida]|uniref:Uncharacterized protein n=1 Tax=Thelonectria olida TaxID=1576542 RepID=A0A9P8WHZ5_9HYPO|nr:hypothetical protein B0T10DRAFT_453678 [Thelonectria olida]
MSESARSPLSIKQFGALRARLVGGWALDYSAYLRLASVRCCDCDCDLDLALDPRPNNSDTTLRSLDLDLIDCNLLSPPLAVYVPTASLPLASSLFCLHPSRPRTRTALHSASRSLTITKRETDGGRFAVFFLFLASIQPLGFALSCPLSALLPLHAQLSLSHSPAPDQTSRHILTRFRSLPGPIGERAFATSCNPACPNHTPAPRILSRRSGPLTKGGTTTTPPSNRAVYRLRQRLRVCVRVCLQRIPSSRSILGLKPPTCLVNIDVVRSAHTLPPRTLTHTLARAHPLTGLWSSLA